MWYCYCLLPCLVSLPFLTAAGVAGLFVLLEDEVILEGVVDLGGSVELLPVIDIPLPLLLGTFEVDGVGVDDVDEVAA